MGETEAIAKYAEELSHRGIPPKIMDEMKILLSDYHSVLERRKAWNR